MDGILTAPRGRDTPGGAGRGLACADGRYRRIHQNRSSSRIGSNHVIGDKGITSFQCEVLAERPAEAEQENRTTDQPEAHSTNSAAGEGAAVTGERALGGFGPRPLAAARY